MTEPTTRQLRAATYLSYFIVCAGCAVLLGWQFRIPILKGVAFGTFVSPNAAACFVLCGVSLLLQIKMPQHRVANRIALGLASVVTLFAAATCFEYFLHADFGIDRLLMSYRLDDWNLPTPGRFVLNSAIGFTLAGVSLVTLRRKGKPIAEILGCLVLLIAYQSLLGYLLSAALLYSRVMALETVLLLLSLAVALICGASAHFILRVLYSPYSGAIASRRILIAIALFLPALSFVELRAEKSGHIPLSEGTAISTVIAAAAFAILAVQTASALNEAEEKRANTEGERNRAESAVRQNEEELRILQRVGNTLASELDLKKLVQAVTDAGRELSEAGFGAFFYNVVNRTGESYMLYTLSGVPEEAFSKFPMPRNTEVFAPTFAGKGTIRLDDVLKDPRYGKNSPHHGMPKGHLPVRSYLAVPVISRSGEVLGGLFYGHSQPAVFTARAERLVEGLAQHAAIAIDNARLFDEGSRTRTQAQANAERLRAIFNSSAVGVAVLSPEMRFLEMNGAFCSITGFPEEELISRDWTSLMPQDDLDPLNSGVKELLAGEIPSFAIDKQYRRKDGSLVWVQNSASLIRTENTDPQVILICHDITARKQAELASRRAAAIVDNSDDAIVSKNLDGVITTWNQAAERLFGYTAEEAVGKHITLIIPLERRSEEDVIINRIRNGIRVEHFETVRVRKDGTTVDVSLSISPVRDAEGKVIGASKVARDVSERKRTEERLLRTEKMAAAGQLAASLAHEINNPLSAVTNALYLLRHHSELDSQSKELVAMANSELARTARIVKQSLSYYRAGSVPKDISVGAILEESLQVFGGKFERSGIEVIKKIRPTENIVGFADEIRQTIDNLLLNAAEAMVNGGKLVVSLRPAVDWKNGSRPAVRMTVADSGPGISKEIRARIFEPFFTTKPEKGTGLGLWVVRGLVSKHDGTIRIRSSADAEKSGTTISVIWPLTTSAQETRKSMHAETVV